MRTTNTRRHLTFGLMAAAWLAALLMLTAVRSDRLTRCMPPDLNE